MKKIILLSLLISFYGNANESKYAESIGVPFKNNPTSKILEMGVLSEDINSQNKSFYTVWCIGGDTFIATRTAPNAVSKYGVVPFTDNMVGLKDSTHALACMNFKSIKAKTFK
ncbi:MAG: hypothetical protein HRU38_10945 [Saccharospirillaceae bacterium]|nr:hypothetical protein [Saccharospirillaceae bacterium]